MRLRPRPQSGKPQQDRCARRHQPGQQVKTKAVDDVGERIPIQDVLRVFRTLHDALPQLDGAAGAHRDAAHRQQGCGLTAMSATHDRYAEAQWRCARRLSLVGFLRVDPVRPCGTSAARAPSGVSTRRSAEAGLFVSAYRAAVRRIGVCDRARRSRRQQAVDEAADERRAVAALDHVRFADELIDAARALRLQRRSRSRASAAGS